MEHPKALLPCYTVRRVLQAGFLKKDMPLYHYRNHHHVSFPAFLQESDYIHFLFLIKLMKFLILDISDEKLVSPNTSSTFFCINILILKRVTIIIIKNTGRIKASADKPFSKVKIRNNVKPIKIAPV